MAATCISACARALASVARTLHADYQQDRRESSRHTNTELENMIMGCVYVWRVTVCVVVRCV